MLSLVYEGLPSRVIFGVGCLDRLPEETDRLGASRVLVLSTAEQAQTAEEVANRLGKCAAGAFTDAVMHVPVEIATARGWAHCFFLGTTAEHGARLSP